MKTTIKLCILLTTILPALFVQAQITFTEIPTLEFLDDQANLRGISWIDVDNDTDLDVCVSGAFGIAPIFFNQTAIYINEGSDLFVNNNNLVSTQSNPYGHAWADIDNDGDLDAYFAATWNGLGINELWLNDGTGMMTNDQATGATPMQTAPYDGNVAWGDFNNDGFVDLFLPRWNNMTNKIYQNEGDGTFSEIIIGEIVNDEAWTSAAIWGDYDNDNDLDLYVVNFQAGSGANEAPAANDLFENNGNGFLLKASGAGEVITDEDNSLSANWVDVNNDGFLDLFVVNQNTVDKLYTNNGDGTFSSAELGINEITWSSNWGDYDNDGDQDLYVMSFLGGDSKLWENDGSGVLADITDSFPDISTETNGSKANGVVFVDYDTDGWLDLHLTQPLDSPDKFYRNEGDTCKAWLQVKLRGTESNGIGIGAVVRAKANVGGHPLWQMQQVSSQSSRIGQNPIRLHFGFEKAAVIDSLVVEWPSGNVCVLQNVAVNRLIQIEEAGCIETTLITPPPIPGTTSIVSICNIGQDTLFTPPSAPGGIWSANCGSCIGQDGTFFSSTTPVGNYEVLYNEGGICGTIDTFLVELGTTFGKSESLSFCVDADDITLEGLSGLGGSWSADCGSCIDPNGMLSVSTLDTGMYMVFYELNTDCAVLNDTIAIEVVGAFGMFDELTFCEGGDDVLLERLSGEGGTFSADCGNCIDPAGLLAVSTLDTGMYEVYYELSTPICPLIVDTIFVFVQSGNAGIDSSADWCEGSGAFDFMSSLGGNPDPGGEWYDMDFEEVVMPYEPISDQELLYYVARNGECTDTSTISITIQNLPEILVSEDTTIFQDGSAALLAMGGDMYSWFPTSGLSCSDCADPVFTAGETTVFTITGFNNFGCQDTASVTVTVTSEAFRMPNTFTPNGDGLNDAFMPVFFEGVFETFHMTIYNRWGELVFETMDPNNGWNGEYQNERATSDAYIYILDYQLKNGEKDVMRGDLTLIR